MQTLWLTESWIHFYSSAALKYLTDMYRTTTVPLQ